MKLFPCFSALLLYLLLDLSSRRAYLLVHVISRRLQVNSFFFGPRSARKARLSAASPRSRRIRWIVLRGFGTGGGRTGFGALLGIWYGAPITAGSATCSPREVEETGSGTGDGRAGKSGRASSKIETVGPDGLGSGLGRGKKTRRQKPEERLNTLSSRGVDVGGLPGC